MRNFWLPNDWENGDLFALGAVGGGMKRSRGTYGTYLESFEEITGGPVVFWKRIVDFASIYSFAVLVERFKSARSESHQDANGSSSVVVLQSLRLKIPSTSAS